MRKLDSASYRSSLSFLLVIAAKRLLKRTIVLRHSISDAYYWEFQDGNGTAPEEVTKLSDYLHELVKLDMPFDSRMMSAAEAINIFEHQGDTEIADLFRLSWVDPVEVYFCDNTCGYYYAPLVESTSVLSQFKLFSFAGGMCLQFPKGNGFLPFNASAKLSSTFLDYAEWLAVLGVSYMSSLHRAINLGKAKQLVLVSEAFHAQKISNIAESIARRGMRIVTIAGPSSSGKTTFSERLKIQLCVCGKRPVTLPMDNYFIDREYLPRDEKGESNFEVPEALDIKLLSDNLLQMLRGDKVQTPLFDFIQGKKIPGKVVQLAQNDVLIMEGIHGLNDKIIGNFPKDELFTIFAAPMTGICLDPHNRTSTSDNRLMRRIVRDNRTRGYEAEKTLSLWPKVVAGAAQFVFPYQERADAVFNSSLPYELAVLKSYIHPLLHSVHEKSPVFSEVLRLQRMLKFVPMMSAENIPNNSVLREFIGGTCFEDVEK